MRGKFLHLFFIVLAGLTLGARAARAQDAMPSRGGAGEQQKEDFPKGIQESLVKQRIEREKKDFAQMLERGEEAVRISGELEKSFAETNQLSAEDRKKLDRLEKLVKKIRSELGGDDDEAASVEINDEPLSMKNAFGALQNTTVKLAGELKKTTRHTVSVVAVESSNLLLKVVRFLRFGKSEK